MSENHPSFGGRVDPSNKSEGDKFVGRLKEKIQMEDNYKADADKFLLQADIKENLKKMSDEEMRKINKNTPPPLPSDSK